jgi:phosphate transport system ATP-binding protein
MTATGMQVRDLRVSYGTLEVLTGIDLTFAGGSVTAIIGPSGCGKTTLLSTLNRLSELSPDCRVQGRVMLEEVNVLEMDPVLLRRRVGMVFQRPNPFPMSIRDNVLYGVRAAKLRVSQSETVRACLERAALWEEVEQRLSDHAFGLSLGQQQRLCLARALAISPEVILMDEPTASLDPTSSARIEASIHALKHDYTVIIVTHNMQQAQRVSDYTAFLYAGELVEFAPTAQLFDKPAHDLTRQYVTGAMA